MVNFVNLFGRFRAGLEWPFNFKSVILFAASNGIVCRRGVAGHAVMPSGC